MGLRMSAMERERARRIPTKVEVRRRMRLEVKQVKQEVRVTFEKALSYHSPRSFLSTLSGQQQLDILFRGLPTQPWE